MLADECSTLKRYDKARELYQYVAENCPDNELAIWAQQGVAILSIKLGDFAAAGDEVDKLLTDFSEHNNIAKAVNKVADHYRWSKRYEKARRLYQYVVDNWPQAEYAIWSQKSLVISYIQFVDDPNADAAIEKLLAGFSKNKQKANAVKMLADECSTLKRYKKARRLYQYFVESFPDSDSAIWAQQGVTISNIKLRDDDAARVAVEKLISDFSEHKDIAKAVNKAADHYRWSKKYEEARRLYQYVVDNWPQAEYAIWSQKSLVTSYIQLGDDPNADAAIEKLLTDYSEHKQIAKAVNMLADEFTMLNRFDRAFELYQYVIDHRPEDKSAKQSEMEIAKINVLSLIKSGDYAKAMDALDTLIADFNDQPELAAAIFQVGEKYYNKALSYKKNKLEPEMKENFEKTIAVWERVITDLPISDAYTPRFYYITAVIYSQEMGEYRKGIEYYQKVVDNWPDYEFAWHAQFFVGMYYEKLRNSGGLPKSEANPKIEKAYKAVLEKYPDSESAPYAALKLGYVNLGRHKWSDAVHYFEMFILEDDGHAPNFLLTKALYYLGQAYEQLNEFDKAIAIYSIFLQIVDPDDSHIKIVIAKLEKLEGEKK
jgi:tetratricopeptide (TPR) repeat protein